jgi:hypothetical protein
MPAVDARHTLKMTAAEDEDPPTGSATIVGRLPKPLSWWLG